MLVSRWSYQSGSLRVIGQQALRGIGCKRRVKLALVIGRFRSIYCQSDRSVRSPFVSFVFVFDKSIVRHLYLFVV